MRTAVTAGAGAPVVLPGGRPGAPRGDLGGGSVDAPLGLALFTGGTRGVDVALLAGDGDGGAGRSSSRSFSSLDGSKAGLRPLTTTWPPPGAGLRRWRRDPGSRGPGFGNRSRGRMGRATIAACPGGLSALIRAA